MKNIILISCCKSKLSEPASAEKLYVSNLFKKSLCYAKLLNPDQIYILSAKHGLVTLSQKLSPYDECLNTKTVSEKKEWAKNVISELSKVSSLKNDNFVILTGKNYYQFLLPHITNYDLPMEHLPQGKRLQWLDKQIEICSSSTRNNLYYKIHDYCNKLKRYYYPFKKADLPKNGIYIMFEKSETYLNFDRIVRVGTHTGDNNLPSRLIDHYYSENKDRSILRKNIGRAILNKNKDNYLKIWNIDFTSRKNRILFSDKRDIEKEKKLEEEISTYIRKNISFACIQKESKAERISLEKKLLNLLSLYDH